MEAYAVQEAAREIERIRIAREQAMQSGWGLRACCSARSLPPTEITQRVARARIVSTRRETDVCFLRSKITQARLNSWRSCGSHPTSLT